MIDSLIEIENDLQQIYNVDFHEKNDIRHYLFSYEYLVKNIESLPMTESGLISAAHMVYGWMPRILKINMKHINQAALIYSNVIKENVITYDEINILKKTINNSLVGTSKLLHFTKPSIFPIWDNHVVNYLNNFQSIRFSVNNTKEFCNYISICSILIKRKRIQAICNHINNNLGHNLTKIRALELAMFKLGKDSKYSNTK